MNNPKFISFYTMVYFISVLICLVIEGSYLGSGQSEIINNLIPFNVIKIGGVVPIPAINVEFFTQALPKILTWDYSFYTGGYEILRWFWLATLSPGLAWGVGTFFIAVFAEFVRVF